MLGGGAHCRPGLQRLHGTLTRAALQMPADLYIAHYPAALPAVARRRGDTARATPTTRRIFTWATGPTIPPTISSAGWCARSRAATCRAVPTSPPPRPVIAEAYARGLRHRAPARACSMSFRSGQAPPGPTPQGDACPGHRSTGSRRPSAPIAGSSARCARSAWRARRPHLYLRGTPAAGYRRAVAGACARGGAAAACICCLPTSPTNGASWPRPTMSACAARRRAARQPADSA